MDMHNTADHNLVDSATVCKLLHMDRSTLTRHVQAGKIQPTLKMPGLRGGYLFHPDEVERAQQSSPGRTRTGTNSINSAALCHLSYRGTTPTDTTRQAS